MGDKFLAIYDLRILPLSLGDIVSWIAIEKLNSLYYKIEKFDVAVIYPDNFSGNEFNPKKNIEYWRHHFTELKQLFDSDDSINSCLVLNDIEQFENIESYINGTYLKKEINQILQSGDSFLIRSYAAKYQKFDLFYEYYQLYGKKIILNSKLKIIKETEFILRSRKISDIVICQPRFRNIDPGLPVSEPNRDCNFFAWLKFFEDSSRIFPNKKFIICGRREAIPEELSRYDNVIFSRDIGLSLANEVALLRTATIFVGASSGFAIVANFSNVPYIIFNLKNPGYTNYKLDPDKKNLIFAEKNQLLVPDQINIEEFLRFFQRDFSDPKVEDFNIWYPKVIFKKNRNKGLNYIINLIEIDLILSFNDAINNDNTNLNKIIKRIFIVWPEYRKNIIFTLLEKNKYIKFFAYIFITRIKFKIASSNIKYVYKILIDKYKKKTLVLFFLEKIKKYGMFFKKRNY